MKILIKLIPMGVDLAETPVPLLDFEGTTLIINGEALDFGFIADGDVFDNTGVEGPNGEYFLAPITKEGDMLYITLKLPHGPNPSQHVAFPEPILVTEAGPIELPFDEVPSANQQLEIDYRPATGEPEAGGDTESADGDGTGLPTVDGLVRDSEPGDGGGDSIDDPATSV